MGWGSAPRLQRRANRVGKMVTGVARTSFNTKTGKKTLSISAPFAGDECYLNLTTVSLRILIRSPVHLTLDFDM
jgi:hypothetical protein